MEVVLINMASSGCFIVQKNEPKIAINRIMEKTIITIETIVNAGVDTVWKSWTTPSDIIEWNFASDDWCTTRAENDLRVGGKFNSRMEARDGTVGFDFEGTYLSVIHNKQITYSIADGRLVKVDFEEKDGKTKVTESFEAEDVNSADLQRSGWQAILNNFKKYTESLKP
jgi:uncharacterized protein YndB with AHSA1/START domain